MILAWALPKRARGTRGRCECRCQTSWAFPGLITAGLLDSPMFVELEIRWYHTSRLYRDSASLDLVMI
jgi:hypothetical protein